MKRLDLISNLAVIFTSVVLLGFLANAWFESHNPPKSPVAQSAIGSTIHLSGIDFAQKDKTLLIAISSTCHFCQESEPFYRQLATMSGNKANLLAILPMPQAEAESYVHTAISPSLRAVSASLNTIGVISTPTLLLVNRQGRVERRWVGKLDDAGQKQVQSQL